MLSKQPQSLILNVTARAVVGVVSQMQQQLDPTLSFFSFLKSETVKPLILRRQLSSILMLSNS